MKLPNQKEQYQQLNKRLARYVLMVQKMIEDLNVEASKIALESGYNPADELPFMFKRFPKTRKRVEELQEMYVDNLSGLVYSGIDDEWRRSNIAQDLLAEGVLTAHNVFAGGKKYQRYFNTNSAVLQAFKKRKEGGLNLSQKIWRQSVEYRNGVEASLAMTLQNGIEKGMSAVTLSKRVSKYLNDYDKLRADYKERFGKATDIRDCQYQAIRLARSEINMAYRTAEQTRWQQMDFIVGYEIKLSKQHPHRMPHGDICDDLQGKYPKNFNWTGWHPNDMCYVIPILKTEDELWDIDDSKPSVNEVKDVPQGFKDWVADNKERIENARKRGTLPYFVRDNEGYISNINAFKSNRMSLKSSLINGISNLSQEQKKMIRKDIYAISKELKLFPNYLQIEFDNNPLDGTIMSINEKGLLKITQAKFQMNDGSIFAPSELLVSAFDKLKRKETLSFNEEYIIESLFHESIHSKSKKKIKVKAGSLEEMVMESCVQMYAREKYVKILEYYGVKPINFDKIRTEGYGYKESVAKLRALFTKNDELQIGEIINIANETENGLRIIEKKLKQMGYTKEEIRKYWISFKLQSRGYTK